MRHFGAWLVVLMLAIAVGCATTSKEMQTYKGLAASGAAVDALGQQMQQVNGIFVVKCKDKSLSAKTCNDFIAFGEKFKAVYPATVALWKSSRTVSDTVLRGRVEEMVASLISELTTFGMTVGLDVATALKK
jgi:hypothetical protein